MAALSRVVAALSLLLVWSAAVIDASELTEPDRPEAPQDDVLELMKERGFSDEEMEMVKEKPELLNEFRNLLQPGPQVPTPQTPDPQTPVPRLPGLVHRLLPEVEQEETPDPQTPDPQTPGPQTPDPQTPVPRLPVLVDRLLAEAEAEQGVMEELKEKHDLGLLDSEEEQILAILEWKAHEGTLGDGGVMEILQNDAAEWVGDEADEVMKEMYRKRTEKENSPPLAFDGGDKEPDDEYDYESKEEEGEEEEGTVYELLAEAEEEVMEGLETEENMYTDDGSDYEWHTTWQDNERGESDDGQDKEEALYEWNMETRPAETKPVDYAPYENAYNHDEDGYYHYGDGYNYHGYPIDMESYDSWYYRHHARSHRVYWGILGGFAGLIVMVTVGAAAAFFYQKRRKRRFLYKPLSSSVIV